MSQVEQNRTLSRRWFAEVWNQGRLATIDELCAPDAVIHGLDETRAQPLVGPENFKRFYDSFRSGFSDIRVNVEDVVAEGDRTAIRLTFTAVHSGKGFGMEPTGRHVRGTAIIIARWRDGRMVESWNEFDADGLVRQIFEPRSTASLRVP